MGLCSHVQRPARGVSLEGVRANLESDAQVARAKDWQTAAGTGHVATGAHSTSGEHVHCADCTVERVCLH